MIFFPAERKQFFKSYFYKRPNVIKFKEFLSTDNVKELIQLSKFVDIILKKVFICQLSFFFVNMYISLYGVCERVCVHSVFHLFMNMYFACMSLTPHVA